MTLFGGLAKPFYRFYIILLGTFMGGMCLGSILLQGGSHVLKNGTQSLKAIRFKSDSGGKSASPSCSLSLMTTARYTAFSS